MKIDTIDASAFEFRHLRYFVAVFEQRSFSAAALQLHVSQPPLTRQIQQLEQALGVELLLRQPRGVEPTDAGQVFYAEAKNLLLLADQALARAQLAGNGQLGRLDIGIFGSAVFGAIPRVMQEFRARYSKVEVVLHTLDRTGQIKALRERRITVGFNRFFQEETDLSWEVIQTERLNVAVHQAHPLARQRMLSLKQLGNQPLILYPRAPRPGFIEQMMRLFHQRGILPQVITEVDDVVTAVALVSSGFGLSLVTDSACNLSLPGIVYVPLRPADRADFELSMIYRNDDESALLQAFIGTVRSLRAVLSTPPSRTGSNSARGRSPHKK